MHPRGEQGGISLEVLIPILLP